MFRLARQLGGRSVAEWESILTSRELTEWMAFETIEPGYPTREDFQSAIIACTIANVNRGKGKAYKLTDFILRERGVERPNKEVVANKLLMFARLHNKVIEASKERVEQLPEKVKKRK